jgi:hypothetical protein
MGSWWQSLTPINRAFFSAAAFCSVFFIWQMLAALIGLGSDDGMDDVSDGGDIDSDMDVHDGHVDHFEAGAETDSTATVVAFKLVSIRAIITFCTLFTWGTALYLNQGESLTKAMGISAIWGLAGMACIALLLSLLPKLADTGTKRIATSLGNKGTVYLDIPANGQGEIRVAVSGVVSFVKARSSDKSAIKAGTPVVVKQIIDESTVEVETVTKPV